jgi:predicted choloylglycine hydrolase
MKYYGSYGFKDFLKKGANNDKELENSIMKTLTGNQSFTPSKSIACTMFSAQNEAGDYITGRNFDFDYTPALLLFTNPPDGYASVSMVNLSFAGYDKNHLPTSSLKKSNFKMLGTPYLPFDGMNECGLSMGFLSVPFSQPGKDPEKVTINTTTAIRLVLDYAKNVDEAISLLKKYNIYFSAGIKCHYLISDSSGKSVVVEYINNKMEVVPRNEKWQVVTNFVLSTPEKQGEGDTEVIRYEKADTVLRNGKGIISENNAMELLHQVRIPNRTLWSVVYNRTTGRIKIAMGMKYNQVKQFNLKMKSRSKIN